MTSEDRIKELEAEVQHWKANHDNMVERSKILINRRDMPVERVKAFAQIGRLQFELAAALRAVSVVERNPGVNLCEELVQQVLSVCPENYAGHTFNVTAEDGSSIGDVIITVVKPDGESPHDLRVKADAALVELHKSLTIAEQRIEKLKLAAHELVSLLPTGLGLDFYHARDTAHAKMLWSR